VEQLQNLLGLLPTPYKYSRITDFCILQFKRIIEN
jgi:hypothetical protein